MPEGEIAPSQFKEMFRKFGLTSECDDPEFTIFSNQSIEVQHCRIANIGIGTFKNGRLVKISHVKDQLKEQAKSLINKTRKEVFDEYPLDV